MNLVHSQFINTNAILCPEDALAAFQQASSIAPPRRDPLILDLDGDGIETVASTNGAYFDHDGNGFAERTGWAGSDDGLLVLDRDSDGIINNGTELFGDQTILQNGQTASNGFQALAEFDANSDGRIDANDAVYTQLKIWQDLDGDGYSQADEMKSLSDLGIAAINTGYTNTNINDGNGNTQVQAGTFEKADSTTGQIGGFMLQRDTAYTIAEEWLEIPEAIALLPDLQGYGNVYDLHQAMVRDTSDALKTLVESFMAETDPHARGALLDQILFKWTGTESISPSSRGPNIDARKLASLEALFGQSFVGIDGTGNPNTNAAPVLNQAYAGMFEMYYSQLMAQTHLQDFYNAITYSWDDVTQCIKGDLVPVLAEIQAVAALDRDAVQLTVIEFMRTLAGVQAQGMLNMDSFREAVSAWDTEFGLLVYSESGHYVYGSSSNDTLTGSGISDVLVGLDGNDVVSAGSGNDTVYGGDGNDVLYGGCYLDGGNDILLGGAGNDVLYGEYGDDILDGGPGDDLYAWVPYQTDGNDTFVYGRESGNDTIQRGINGSSNLNGSDTVLFGEGLTPDSFDYLSTGLATGGDLVIRIKDTGETLTIKNWFAHDFYKVEKFRFADGTELNASAVSELAQITVTGTEGDDNLSAAVVSNRRNTVYGLAGNDTLAGGYRDDTIDAGDGNDVVSAGSGNDTVYGGDGNDVLYGGCYLDGGNDILLGGAGNDVLYGEYGDDILDGGPGDDLYAWVPYQTDGNDTFVYGRESGNDTIQRGINGSSNLNGSDTVLFGEGLTPDSFDYLSTGLATGGDLVIRIKDTGETLTIKNWFAHDFYKVEKFRFADGTELNASAVSELAQITVTGTEGDDNLSAAVVSNRRNTVYGLAGNDTLAGGYRDDLLAGGTGNDALNGGAGQDTYRFDLGDGIDTITDAGSDSGNEDKIAFGEDVNKNGIAIYSDGTNLTVAYGETDRLVVSSQFSSSYGIEKMQSADGLFLTNADINGIIQDMTAFAQSNGIPMTGVEDVRRNQDLMNIIVNSWHA
ncbi:MAG TPA: calcium-binding protein [Syntrophales bacterium]|nr:calcium-binding protein [Syntrophales bacterium]